MWFSGVLTCLLFSASAYSATLGPSAPASPLPPPPFEEILFGHEFEVRDKGLAKQGWKYLYNQIFNPGMSAEDERQARILSQRYTEDVLDLLFAEISREIKEAKDRKDLGDWVAWNGLSDIQTIGFQGGSEFGFKVDAGPDVGPSSTVRMTIDPYVIEVKGTPLPLSAMKQLEPQMQKNIFDRLASHGFTPPTYASGGHITIDWVTAFGSDAPSSTRAALNFVTDWINQDFASGTLSYDVYNAEGVRDSATILKAFSEQLKKIQKLVDEKKMIKALRKLDDFTVSYFDKGSEIRMDYKFDPTTGKIVSGKIEIRALRAQQSYAEYIKLCELFQARIHWIRKNYVDSWVPLEESRSLPNLAHLSRFQRYVEQVGLSYEPYRPIAARAFNLCNVLLTPLKLWRRIKYFEMADSGTRKWRKHMASLPRALPTNYVPYLEN